MTTMQGDGLERDADWLALVMARPGRVLLAVALMLALLGVGLGRTVKDGSVDAFVPLDHPAAVARDLAADNFGLEDPIIIGLSAADGNALQPAYLEVLRRLHESVRTIEDVRKDDVLSLAGEKAMLRAGGDLEVGLCCKNLAELRGAAALTGFRRCRRRTAFRSDALLP